jgi:hypothetical protein
MTGKIEHKGARMILNRDTENIPPDVEAEDLAARWADGLYRNMMYVDRLTPETVSAIPRSM